MYPNATINQVISETENGEAVYDVETNDNGIERDLLITPSGTIIEVGEHLRVSDLHTAISSAALNGYPNGKIEEAERKLMNGETFYEVMVENGNTDIELRISPTGSLLSTIDDDQDEEENGDDD